jgi:hypothetical protein
MSLSQEDHVPLIIRQIVDRLHVGASNGDVVRAVRASMDRRFFTPEHRRWRQTVYRLAIDAHKANRDLYQQVMSGRIRDSMRVWPDLEAEAAADLETNGRPDA